MDWINAKHRMPTKFSRYGWYVKINDVQKLVLSHDEILKKLPYCNTIVWLDEAKAGKSEIADDNETIKARVGIIEDHLHNLENLMGVKKSEKLKIKIKAL